MADTGKPEDGPSLEMPSLSLRRRQDAPSDQDPDPRSSGAPATEPPAPKVAHAPLGGESESDVEPELAGQGPAPALSGIAAVALTGLVVGGLAVLLTWLAVSGCDTVRGTASCGGGPGLVVLVAVLVVLAGTGGWLLRRFGVPDAGSTSVLAVGVMAVVVMLFLLEALDQWWVVIAVPVVSLLAHLLSWWVTTAVVDPDDSSTPVPTR